MILKLETWKAKDGRTKPRLVLTRFPYACGGACGGVSIRIRTHRYAFVWEFTK